MNFVRKLMCIKMFSAGQRVSLTFTYEDTHTEVETEHGLSL